MHLYEWVTIVGVAGLAIAVISTLVNINTTLDAIRKAAIAYVDYTESNYCDCEEHNDNI